MKNKQYLNALAFGLALALVCGCSPEKAEAIKTAADQFRTEAVAALSQIKALFRRSVAIPTDTQDQAIKRLVNDLSSTNTLTTEELAELLHGDDVNAAALKTIDTELGPLEDRYHQFAAMFQSLPQGSYLAAASVKKAEKHAINLSLEFINFARFLEKYPAQFTDQRVLLIENINQAKSIPNAGQRNALLERHAEALLHLKQDEAKAKSDAILQCLKAAESCRTVAGLIRNYDSLNAAELLGMARQALSFAAEVSGGNADVAGVLKRFDAVETDIRADAYWKPMLEVNLTGDH